MSVRTLTYVPQIRLRVFANQNQRYEARVGFPGYECRVAFPGVFLRIVAGCAF